ncbi:alpha/beta hydrolase [Achromobacter aloeverae]|uniref:Alpha/beta hydrolase n=1 Tax=Achromobacter aloeverae TaxID=1750518 RepID=A0A4Q1HFG9_9BURK|nr:alpha/beta hydrolase-fold protein [Achromobacter aloeverae]RXN85445.1 alpha/beta hydrolase [Achromobacter aloeverae]
MHGRWDEPVGPTVADRPSADYRYEKHRLDSADGKRHYRIEIAIPRQAAPAGGHAALYMLDGNAAMATLTSADLQAMGTAHPPVLVAIGYDIDTRNDVVARAYDYTPPVRDAQGREIPAPVVRGRVGGGADVFLDFIETQVRPLARSRASIDPGREMLWGHSYGGLFTLHVLYTRPRAFSAYIAGDPSAWWHDGALIQEWRAFDPARASGLRVAILAGTKPRADGKDHPGTSSPTTTTTTTTTTPATPGSSPDPRDVVAGMAQKLRSASVDATYEAFPQFGHGEMIRASLARALQIASGATSIQP